MRKFHGLFRTILFIGAMVLSEGLAAKEGLNFVIGPQWMFLKDETADKSYTMTFIPEGQTAENWRSLLEVVNASRKSYPKTVREAQTMLLDLHLEDCPETTLETIVEDNASSTFAMKSVNCLTKDNPYRLTKILYGKKNVYLLIFTQKGGETSPDTKEQWLKVLNNASIRK